MGRKELELLVLCSALGSGGGLIGNVVANHATLRIWSSASAATPTNRVVSASEFDLVGPNGNIGAKLFMDRGANPTLSLYDGEGKEAVLLHVVPGETGLTLRSGHDNIKLKTYGMGAYMMFLDQDSLIGARVDLSFNNNSTDFSLFGPDYQTTSQTFAGNFGASAYFTDNKRREMVGLGVDNALSPYPENARIDIYDTKGNTRAELNNSLSLFDGTGKTRAELNDALSLSDETGKTRAVVGSTVLKNLKTGSTTTLSPSSVVLFGENGHVLWQSP